MVKDDVLKILETNQGKIVSGGEISRSLGVSRTAVWKAIAALKEEGFDIESLSNHGYVLSLQDDTLSEYRISWFLKTNELGKKIIIFNTIDSTNVYAMNTSNLEHGSVVLSNQQTQGKGRIQRSFYSPSNNGIYMSLFLRPNLSLEKIGLITIIGSLAVCNAIYELTEFRPSIKWVNDIFMKGKKVCGILTQAKVEGESGAVEYVVLGIGINVLETEFPVELKKIATSIQETTGLTCNRNQLVALILNHLEDYLIRLNKGDITNIIQEYRENLFMLGKEIVVIKPDSTFNAIAKDVNEKGNLIVVDEDGKQQVLISGEISIKL